MRKLALLPLAASLAPLEREPDGAAAGGNPAPVPADTARSPPDAPAGSLPLGELQDIAFFLGRELAAHLARAGAFEVRVVELAGANLGPIRPDDLGGFALAAGAGLALGGQVRATAGELQVTAALATDSGEPQRSWRETVPLGQGPWLGQLLARATLLALGEDDAAPPEVAAAPVPPELFLGLCRAARQLSESARHGQAQQSSEAPARKASLAWDPTEALTDLVLALEAAPSLEPARALLLESAEEALGGPWMPSFLAALERLAELRPDDSGGLLALGDYRRAHLDAEGARALYLAAREHAPDDEATALALSRLALLAEEAGRTDEAALHLRAAVRLLDDAQLYLRLASALRAKEPLEALRALQRAAVLAPQAPVIQLQLAHLLNEQGAPERAAAAAARAAQLAARDPAFSAESHEAATLLRSLLQPS